jgi:hypothetical protein
VVLTNFSINLAIMHLGYPYYEKHSDPDVYKLPTTYQTFFYLYLALLGHDAFFYHGHRLAANM